MAKNKNINRRQEQRVALPDLTLKVRKTGFSHSLYSYELCRSVDLSLNGFSFCNETLELKVPEKVDFILIIEGNETKGHAVTCNKRESSSGTYYGLMFLSIFPEISSVFSEHNISTQALENMAINQAEHLVHALMKDKSRQETIILSKQQQLFDACRCYLIRLGEMGVRMSGMQPGILLHPIQAVKIFRDPESKLLLKWHNLTTGQSEQLSIALGLEILSSSFVINDELHCKNVEQVLQHLGQKLTQHFHFI